MLKHRNEVLNRHHVIAITAIYILGTTTLSGGAKIAKQDTWISLIFASLLVLPLYLICCRVIKLNPKVSPFDICIKSFGPRPIGYAISVIVILYSLFVCSGVLREITEFTQAGPLTETPQSIMALLFALLSVFILKQGLKMVGRTAALYILIVAFIIILSFCLNVNQADFNNIKPIFGQDFSTIAQNSLFLFSYPYGEVIIFGTVICYLKDEKKLIKPVLQGHIIGTVLLLISMVTTILSLGGETYSQLYFPSYISGSVLEIGDFFQRIEVFFSVNLLLTSILKFCVCLYAVCKGIEVVFGLKDYKRILLPTATFVIFLSTLLYKNTEELAKTIKYYCYISLPFQILIPLIVWIVSEVRHRRKNRDDGHEKEPQMEGSVG